MGKFGTKASTAAKARLARERELEPINSASYAAVARRGLVSTGPPASSTHAAEETMEDYEGGRERNDIVPPSAAGEPTHETLTNFTLIASHPLSCSCFKPETK